LFGVIDSADQLVSQNWALSLIVSVALGVLWLGLYLALPAFLACCALSARYDQEIRILEAATPAELRLAAEIHRRAEAFRDQAQALEQAMEQAAAITEQVQLELRQEQAEIARMREEYVHQVRLRELSSEETAAIQGWLGAENARTERRAVWVNVLTGIALFVAGVVVQALLPPETLGEQLRQWLHLG
jgi:DNA-binding helix-hairpin-helix protein with protein kinase domain